MKNPIKIVFFGTPEFARVILADLHENFEVVGVIAQPDRPVGRGHKLASPPVAEFAKDQGLPLFQPYKIKDEGFLSGLEALQADFFVVAAYGRILPERLLNLPKFPALNVHASLLPNHRGAAPINYALLNGDEKTGVAIMQMVKELDAGPVYAEGTLEISIEDDAMTLTEKLAKLGAQVLIESLPKILSGELKSEEQDHEQATYSPKLSRELSPISWADSAEKIFNQIRALVPWPVAESTIQGKRLRIFSAKPLVENHDKSPGEIVHMSASGWTVQTGKNALLIQEVQLEGKKRMSASDLGRGLRLETGLRLGE